MRKRNILMLFTVLILALAVGSVAFWYIHKNKTPALTEATQPKPSITILHIANLAQPEHPTLLLPDAEVIGWSDFDAVLFGGNLLQNTTGDSLNFSLLTRTLGLDKNQIFWAVGRQDIANTSLIKAATKRPLFYGNHLNDVGIFVFDTETTAGNIGTDQIHSFQKFLAANKDIKSLIILTNRLVWLYDDTHLSGANIANTPIIPSNFGAQIYPMLQKLTKEGKQVLCVAGDIGNQINQFEYETEEGVYYLASGLHPTNASKSRVLLLRQDATTRLLNWQFIHTAELPN